MMTWLLTALKAGWWLVATGASAVKGMSWLSWGTSLLGSFGKLGGILGGAGSKVLAGLTGLGGLGAIFSGRLTSIAATAAVTAVAMWAWLSWEHSIEVAALKAKHNREIQLAVTIAEDRIADQVNSATDARIRAARDGEREARHVETDEEVKQLCARDVNCIQHAKYKKGEQS